MQDVGDKDIMYEPLLDDIDVETLMTEDDLKIDMGAQDGLQAGGSHPERRGEVGSRGKTSDLRGRGGRWTLAPQAKRCYKAVTFDCNHIVIDSAPVGERDYVRVNHIASPPGLMRSRTKTTS